MNTRITASVVVLIAVAGSAYFFNQGYGFGGGYLPSEFTGARSEGAVVAEKIVFLAHQSLAGLEQIGGLDDQKKYAQALDLITRELQRNSEARQEAILLSSHLGTMAAFLSQIKPTRAQSLATEAVGYEVSLVNRLINFHDLLNKLFVLQQGKFRGEIENSDDLLKKLIDDINKEIKAINNLNLKFNSTMEHFDNIYD